MSFLLIVFNFLLCLFEAMFDVQAQFNGGEPQRLKVRHLGVTLRGIKDQLNEFNQRVNLGDTRMVEYIRYKSSTMREYHSIGWN